jgi:hypothetical protein
METVVKGLQEDRRVGSGHERVIKQFAGFIGVRHGWLFQEDMLSSAQSTKSPFVV